MTPQTVAPLTAGDQSGDPEADTRGQRPTSEAFKKFIASGWLTPDAGLPAPLPAAGPAAARRQRLSAHFPGERLIVPAGDLTPRSNDTDHRFRPHTAFAYFTGLGADREPEAVLVMEPTADGHDATLYFRPRAARDSKEFYADPRYGELWVGSRESLAEVCAETAIDAAHLDGLEAAIAADATPVRVVADASASVTAVVVAARRHGADGPDGPDATVTRAGSDDETEAPDEPEDPDVEFARVISTMRLVKDTWEIDQMRAAVAATAQGFDDIVASLPRAIGHERGERVVEGAFAARSRETGNGLGYDVIAASGDHACTLHWIRNDGVVQAHDLLLVDAGVEVETLYTADVTRTLPVSGHFTDSQRQVYQAVLDAADAAFAEVKPGSSLAAVHAAAMRVIAERLDSWGLLPVGVEEALDPKEGGQHRRWVVHGTSHHLGIDVHDCSLARREEYVDGPLVTGMVFTIEPGLYFRPDDQLVPAALRGIGVRIEDDVVVTDDGYENLTAALPRRPEDVEAWVRTGRR